MVDWYERSNDKPRFFAPDGVHITERGRRAYTKIIGRALGLIDPPPTPTPEPPPPDPTAEPQPEPPPPPPDADGGEVTDDGDSESDEPTEGGDG